MANLFFKAIVAGALGATSLPAHAGDTAELNILGFSADGGIFAFEEYGVQDGSGFPYANRFYIDTATDRFVAGSPIRVTLEDQAASIEAARTEARKRGEKISPQTVLEANRGHTAALNPVTEITADPNRLVAYPLPYFPPLQPALEFRLEEFPLDDAGRCSGLAEMKGFRLLQVDAREGGTTQLLHADESVPQSRGCATGYRLGGLQTFGTNGVVAFAVIIAVERLGFEGPDYRWMAVTRRP